MKYRPYAFDSNHPSAFKRRIHADWLVLDPDVLRAEVPVGLRGRIETRMIEACLARHAPGQEDAFTGWCGIHGSPGPGLVFHTDWDEFLSGLRNARELAARGDIEPESDGGVYPPADPGWR